MNTETKKLEMLMVSVIDVITSMKRDGQDLEYQHAIEDVVHVLDTYKLVLLQASELHG